MKCFHFSNGENNKRGGEDNEDGTSTTTTANVSRVSRVSWARSLSVASSSIDLKRSADYESVDYSRDLSDSAVFHEFLCQRRANDLRVFAFSELKSATRGFSRSLLIGEGGFGCVYKGVVKISADDSHDKMEVAVKQLNRNGLQGHKEWITEVNCLGVVKHPSLVKLVGYCAEDDERGIQRLLVYEFMPNKSLEDHLLARVPQPLSWTMRIKIAHDAARGLAYLHEEMDFQLIFRDFKTSNILLDEDFNAKLSDFGLARQGPSEGLGHVSTSVVGTVGYAAPEYVQTGRLTAKSDVWSFGVVLYELITGRRSVDRNLPKNEQKLLEWVKPYVSGSKRIHVIMDPQLEGQYCRVSVQKLVSLANKCLMKQPKSRPKMSEVVEILGQLISETTLSSDCGVSQFVEEAETGKEKEDGVLDTDSTKHGSSYRRMVFDFKEMISSRNRSVGRLDWRNWAPVVRTW
ncbi:Serine/threonine-protein kinase PCRK1 [Thalictrum thalictroides]|uniref:non-specific serine/threonine protein kinase n=1 Tax=Thalictrum thalictroides TaxID=46969 RepID=A0A7J6W6R1_THATH|nr:Serine/threonine-protein kinase PCRK1 [Thalictrum thalictroides]